MTNHFQHAVRWIEAARLSDGSYQAFWHPTHNTFFISKMEADGVIKYYFRESATQAEFQSDWTNRASHTYTAHGDVVNA